MAYDQWGTPNRKAAAVVRRFTVSWHRPYRNDANTSKQPWRERLHQFRPVVPGSALDLDETADRYGAPKVGNVVDFSLYNLRKFTRTWLPRYRQLHCHPCPPA